MTSSSSTVPAPPLYGRRFLLAAAGAFLVSVFSAEGLCRWAESSGFLFKRMNPIVDLTSRSEVVERLQWGAAQPHALFLFGDSVLGPTAMMQARVRGARNSTLAAGLQDEAAQNGATAVNLGADGLLLTDIESLTRGMKETRPEGVLLVLNFRMFAPEFEGGETSRSRPYLDAALPPKDLSARIEDGLLRHSALFRTTRLLRTLWYHPSQKEFFQRILEDLLRLRSDEDMQRAALVMKTTPYYPSTSWNPDGAPLRALQKTMENLRALGIPVLVVLTPQNGAFLEGRFDPRAFDLNRALLERTLRPYLGSRARYLDWSSHLDRKDFLDHCHLTPDANRRLAADLWSAWGSLKEAAR